MLAPRGLTLPLLVTPENRNVTMYLTFIVSTQGDIIGSVGANLFRDQESAILHSFMLLKKNGLFIISLPLSIVRSAPGDNVAIV